MFILSIVLMILFSLSVWSQIRDTKQKKKIHEETKVINEKRTEAMLQLSKSISESKFDEQEIQMFKRYIRALMEQLEKHEAKMDEVLEATKEADPYEPMDLEKWVKEIKSANLTISE